MAEDVLKWFDDEKLLIIFEILRFNKIMLLLIFLLLTDFLGVSLK